MTNEDDLLPMPYFMKDKKWYISTTDSNGQISYALTRLGKNNSKAKESFERYIKRSTEEVDEDGRIYDI